MTVSTVTDSERRARAAWTHLAELHPGLSGALIADHGPEGALDYVLTVDSPADQSGHALAQFRDRLSRCDVDASLATIDHLDGTLLCPDDPEWPEPLNDLGSETPTALWVRGDPTALTRHPAIAIVGARAATTYGTRTAADLAGGLAGSDLTVVSGGAYGIDAAAHRGALDENRTTVAVLAGGVDRFHPAGNTALLEAITETGAVVSELPPGAVPTRNRFFARNRLIAALTGTTIVVEAAWRSGALSTAAHAAALSRPVGAVPGPVYSMASAGCHRLIRENGATLITDTADAVALLAPQCQPILAR